MVEVEVEVGAELSLEPPPTTITTSFIRLIFAGSEMRGKAVVVLGLIIRMFSLTLTVRTTLRTTLRCHLT